MNKIYAIIMLLLFFITLCSCDNIEEYTYEGLTNEIIFINDDFDKLAGVKVKSSLRGDITSKLIINGEVNNDEIGENELTYSFLTGFSVKRKITVIYPPVSENNLIRNGDFSNYFNYWTYYNSYTYPLKLVYLIDPIYECLKIDIEEINPNSQMPFIASSVPITLDANKTYLLHFFTKGDQDSFFMIDFVEETEIGTFNKVVDATRIDLTQNVYRQYSVFIQPKYSSQKTIIRILFKHADELSKGNIMIDSLYLEANN